MRQASYESLNVLLFMWLNYLNLSILRRRCRLLFEKDNPKETSKFENFFDLYDNIYESDRLDPRYLLYNCMNR